MSQQRRGIAASWSCFLDELSRVALLIAFIALLTLVRTDVVAEEEQTAPAEAGAAANAPKPANTPFPDFGHLPPPSQYTGPVFILSQDYPTQMPTTVPAFFAKLPAAPFSTDFDKGGWRQYLMAARDYCFEGNTDVDFRVEMNKTRPWYHMPWQHAGPAGREGVHGLTKEAEVNIGQLAASQKDSGQTYAVGFFNDFGGYTVGQVWADHNNPNPDYTSAPDGGKGFPDGTVIFKLLFVDNDPAGVPSLANPQQWNAYVTETYDATNRTFKKLSLIQMDIAVKDSRVLPTKWLFGTFQYNGTVGPPSWNNLMPLGVMWGNDPDQTDNAYTQFMPNGLSPTAPPKPPLTMTKVNPKLKESSINTNKKEVPPTHLGWNGRLDGPVDNIVSSCMSCHMTAEAPELSPMNPTFQPGWKFGKLAEPPLGSPPDQYPPPNFKYPWLGGWMRWFQNLECAQPFDAAGNPWTHQAAKSTDYSLQLAVALANFVDWQALQGLYATSYRVRAAAEAQAVGAEPGARRGRDTHIPHYSGQPVFPVTRDPVPPNP